MNSMLMVEAFIAGMLEIKTQYGETKDLKKLKKDLARFAKENKENLNIGDYILLNGEFYITEGDYDAGMVFINTLVSCRIPVMNSVLFYLRMAEYHIKKGEMEKGIEYLTELCTNTVSNYEDSIKANELTSVWEKYKHLVEGSVPKSKSYMTENPKSAEECSMQINEIFSLDEDEILSSLWDHVSEMSADGEYLNSLNNWERDFYYVFELCSEVNSGGFDSYLSYYGTHFGKAYKALEGIGAGQMIKLLEVVKSKFPRGKIPSKIESIQNAIEKLNSKGIDFENEDSEFYESGEKELIAKLFSFATSNKEHFR